VVQVSLSGSCQFECSETDVVERFVVNDLHLVSILDKLVHRESCVVWLDHGIRDLRGREYRECLHDSVRLLLSDLGNEECSHTGSSSSAHRVGHLESLQAVTALSLLSYYVQN